MKLVKKELTLALILNILYIINHVILIKKTMPDQIISQDGYDKLKKELDDRMNVKRLEIAGRIEAAKELGDLSENAEYAEAKDEQAFNDGRIAELFTLLKNVTVVKNNHDKDKVSMGSRVIAKVEGK